MSKKMQVEVLAILFFPICINTKNYEKCLNVKLVGQPASSSPCSGNVTTGTTGHQTRHSRIFQAENGSSHFSQLSSAAGVGQTPPEGVSQPPLRASKLLSISADTAASGPGACWDLRIYFQKQVTPELFWNNLNSSLNDYISIWLSSSFSAHCAVLMWKTTICYFLIILFSYPKQNVF